MAIRPLITVMAARRQPITGNNGVNNGTTFSNMLATNVIATGTDDFDGVGVFTVSNTTIDRDSFLFDRSSVDLNVIIPPAEGTRFLANVDLTIDAGSLTDLDTVCFDTGTGCENYIISAITGTELRFGRLVLGTAVGSELLPVSVPFQVEYFDGTNFVVNTDDVCTSLAVTDLTLDSAVEAAQTDGDIDISNATSCSDPGETGVATAAVTNDPFVSGFGDLSFSLTTPAAGCTGYIDINTDLSILAIDWLRYDWDDDDGNEDGPYDDNPAGRAEFGLYEGPSEYIYIREPW